VRLALAATREETVRFTRSTARTDAEIVARAAAPDVRQNAMRIISWNVRRAQAASPVWKFLLDCAPDVALPEEVGGWPEAIANQYSHRAEFPMRPNGASQNFQTMILVRGSLRAPVSLGASAGWVNAELDRFGGNLVASELTPGTGQALNAVSVYSPAWPVDASRLTGIDVSDVRLTQNADVWVADLLRAALRQRQPMADDAWVAAGDFNLSETFDLWLGGPRGNREYLDGTADLGLVECLRASKGSLTPTFRNTDKRTVKHQIDHLFVTRALSHRLTSCDTGPQEIIFGGNLSDHLPIIADFTV
jgi:exonuclease III